MTHPVDVGRTAFWGNPYSHLPADRTTAEFQVDTKEEAIRRYTELMLERLAVAPEVWRPRLVAVFGKELRCPCGGSPCHKDVIEALAEQVWEEEANLP